MSAGVSKECGFCTRKEAVAEGKILKTWLRIIIYYTTKPEEA